MHAYVPHPTFPHRPRTSSLPHRPISVRPVPGSPLQLHSVPAATFPLSILQVGVSVNLSVTRTADTPNCLGAVVSANDLFIPSGSAGVSTSNFDGNTTYETPAGSHAFLLRP